MEQLEKCVQRCAITDKYKLARVAGYTETPHWKLAEYAVAVLENCCLFMSLDRSIRKMIHGGRDASSVDRGVDVVGSDGSLYQVKWYKKDSTIGHDPISRLNNIADAFNEAGGDVPHRVIVLKAGTRLAAGIPRAYRIETKYYDDAQLDEAVRIAKEELSKVRIRDHKRIGNEVYNKLHTEVVAVLTGLIKEGRAIVSAELPPGSGKSYIIGNVIKHHNLYSPGAVALVVVPRIIIARQLAELYRKMISPLGVAVVAEGSSWPEDLTGVGAIVMSGQSASKIPDGFRASAVVYDEAHVEHGRSLVEERVKRNATYHLSATMPGPVDYRLSYSAAVDMGLICDARFIFAQFERIPTLSDYLEHIAHHPEHTAILACFQGKESARTFAKMCNEKRDGMAMSFVSGDDHEALERFRAGDVRILCVVSRVEMGVNMHICDTILLVNPWDSVSRLRQLCGRATRHYPTKFGVYSVILGVGPDQKDEERSVSRMVDALHNEIGDRCPNTLEGLRDKVEVVRGGAHEPYEYEETDATLALKISIYDSFGRRMTDDSQVCKLRFAVVKMWNVRLRIATREEYLVSEERHPNWVADPKRYYAKQWISWYDFLGVDTSGFPPTKRKWAEICVARGLDESNYFAKKYGDLPPNPSEMYDDFTRFSEELSGKRDEYIW